MNNSPLKPSKLNVITHRTEKRRNTLSKVEHLRSERSESVLPKIKVMKLSEADPYQLRSAQKTAKKKKKDLQSLLSTIETEIVNRNSALYNKTHDLELDPGSSLLSEAENRESATPEPMPLDYEALLLKQMKTRALGNQD